MQNLHLISTEFMSTRGWISGAPTPGKVRAGGGQPGCTISGAPALTGPLPTDYTDNIQQPKVLLEVP